MSKRFIGCRRLGLLIFCIPCFLASHLSAVGFDEILDRHFQKARSAFRERDYVSASIYYFEAMDMASPAKTTASVKEPVDERYYRAMVALAACLYQLKLYYNAAAYYKQVIRYSPGSIVRQGVRGLNNINKKVTLDSTAIALIFHGKVSSQGIDDGDMGFYYYHVGVYLFSTGDYQKAYSYFRRVNTQSFYHINALYYLGILNNLAKKYRRAEHHFTRVLSMLDRMNGTGKEKRYDTLQEMTILNLARLYYETNRFKMAIDYYAKIERTSDNWLVAIFEATWAFFRIGKHNNALGNVHTLESPYFSSRFFPEAQIVKSIIFLNLCFFSAARDTLFNFKTRYRPLFREIKQLIADYKDKPSEFYGVVKRYRQAGGSDYAYSVQLFDALSRMNQYKEAEEIEDNISFSRKLLEHQPLRMRNHPLHGRLERQLRQQAKEIKVRAGQALFTELHYYQTYLTDLSDQGQLITLQMMEGKLSRLQRSMVKDQPIEKEKLWGEGMKPLNIKAVHVYWPFKGEYWEDELGSFVYNIESKCNKPIVR